MLGSSPQCSRRSLSAAMARFSQTATFIQNARKNRRGWKIMTGTAFAVEPDGPVYLMMTFVNEGHRPITVSQMTLELPNRNWLANVDARMPNGQIPMP